MPSDTTSHSCPSVADVPRVLRVSACFLLDARSAGSCPQGPAAEVCGGLRSLIGKADFPACLCSEAVPAAGPGSASNISAVTVFQQETFAGFNPLEEKRAVCEQSWFSLEIQPPPSI